MFGEADRRRRQAGLERFRQLAHRIEIHFPVIVRLQLEGRQWQGGSLAYLLASRFRIADAGPVPDELRFLATERRLAAVMHPVTDFVSRRKSLPDAIRVRIDRDDGLVAGTYDPRGTSCQRAVTDRRAAIKSDGFDVDFIGAGDAQVAEDFRRRLKYSLLSIGPFVAHLFQDAEFIEIFQIGFDVVIGERLEIAVLRRSIRPRTGAAHDE